MAEEIHLILSYWVNLQSCHQYAVGHSSSDDAKNATRMHVARIGLDTVADVAGSTGIDEMRLLSASYSWAI
jgi:hypothetical protein